MVSDFLLLLTFKKLPLVKFWDSIKGDLQVSEKTMKTFFLFQLRIHMGLDLIPRLPPKQQISTDRMQKLL